MAKTVIVKGKEWTKDSVRTLLQTNDKAILRAIKLIYSFQTNLWNDSPRDDSYISTSYISDTFMGMSESKSYILGFSKVDADIMSSFARTLNQGRSLSEKQMIIARKRIVKYSNQIFNYMKSNEIK